MANLHNPKRLKILSPVKPSRLEKPAQQVAPETCLPPDPPGAYTTGIPDLDREIGGYPQGSTILLEIDPRLTPWEYNMIIAPAIASFVLRGRHDLTILSGGVSPDTVKEMNSYYGIDERTFLERFHIFYEKGAPIKREQNIMEFNPRHVEEEGRRIIEFGIKLVEETGKPIIANIGVDRIVRAAGEEALRSLFSAQDIVRQYRSLMFWLVKPITPWIVERLAPIADIHLKITREHGCALLYGIKPRTPLYAIQLKPDKTPPIPDLIRIT